MFRNIFLGVALASAYQTSHLVIELKKERNVSGLSQCFPFMDSFRQINQKNEHKLSHVLWEL